MFKAYLRTAVVAIVALMVVLQFIPYGRAHSNPPVSGEPQWDSPQTRDLAKRACFDCHSNETVWPWYSNVAPFSWLIQRDVTEGRGKLNFSEWNRPQHDAEEAAKEVREGEMPMWFYLPLHPEARLAAAEKDLLIRGLDATLGNSENPEAYDQTNGHEGGKKTKIDHTPYADFKFVNKSGDVPPLESPRNETEAYAHHRNEHAKSTGHGLILDKKCKRRVVVVWRILHQGSRPGRELPNDFDKV
jgi:hypothetical protein